MNLLGGDESTKKSRNCDIMSDSAYLILTSNSKENSGNFYIDEEVLKKHGIKDMKQYQLDPTVDEKDLMPDFFL